MSNTTASRRTIFCALLALAILFHNSVLSDWHFASPVTYLSLVAIWALCRPGSQNRFLVLLTCYFLVFVWQMPHVVNHEMLFGIACTVMVAAALVSSVRHRRLADADVLYRRFAPMLRLHLIIVYYFATLAKLNSGFVHAEGSAAIQMYGQIARLLPFLPDGPLANQFSIWGTLGIEVLLPTLLIFRRSRWLALSLGLPFHTFLTLGGHVPFSGYVLPFYWLFVPDDMPERLSQWWNSWGRLSAGLARAARSRLTLPLLAGGWVALTALDMSALNNDGVVSHRIFLGTLALFWLYAGIAGLAFWSCTLKAKDLNYTKATLSVGRWAPAIGVGLVVFNGLNPFLGLKTEHSFAMYSNLQTEAGQWNHFFMPQAMRIFSYQDDLITITATDDSELAKSVANGDQWIEFELQRYLYAHPETALTFRHRGEVITLSPASSDHRWSQAPGTVFSRWYLLFRQVTPPGVYRLQH